MDKEKREPNKGDNTTGLVDRRQNKELWDLLARRFDYTEKRRDPTQRKGKPAPGDC